MFTIQSRNVNEAYQKGLRLLTTKGEKEESRAGDVLVMPTPVTNVYSKPWERVLFDPKRDANPFFHLMEAVWMLAGQNDARMLDRFISDFSSRFAEDDGLAHGAYGHRWRQHFGKRVSGENEHGVETTQYMKKDQLSEAGRLLRENPHSRQVVLAMWDPATDLGAKKRDIPCNDLVMFRAVGGDDNWRLNMSIVARSHDAVWGAYGANIVHMTVMHEIVAALANMQIGTYTHFSNNFHVYKSVLPRLGDFVPDGHWEQDPYESGAVYATSIASGQKEAEAVLRDSEKFCETFLADKQSMLIPQFETDFFNGVVLPMFFAHAAFKSQDFDGTRLHADMIESPDWKLACKLWLKRRIEAIQKRRMEQDVN